MGKKTKIDWCDATWNPVTGCLHGCEYCYARGIANRFGRKDDQENTNHDLKNPLRRVYRDEDGIQCLGSKLTYPYGFDPTLHRYKLDEPQHWKKPRTIFVCSMADLFGKWVPDEWIREVFDACEKAPQHRYLFLTKNPGRYQRLVRAGIKLPEDCWIGTSSTKNADEHGACGRCFTLSENWNTLCKWFVSVEPILERMSPATLATICQMHWVIVGAESGNRKEKVIPEKAWIDEIAAECDRVGTPIFMKESLRGIMGDDFRQEFPWEVE